MSWSYVQGGVTSFNTSSGTSITTTYASTPTLGDFLVCATCSVGATSSVSDNYGNTWTQRVTFAGQSRNVAIYTAPVTVTGAGFVVTLHATSTFLGMNIDEFSPGGTVSMDGSAQSNSAGGGTAMSTAAVTGTTGDLWYAVAYPFSFSGASAGTGWTQAAQFSAAGSKVGLIAEYQLNGTSPVTPSATQATSAAWVMTGAAFNAASTVVVPYWHLFASVNSSLAGVP